MACSAEKRAALENAIKVMREYLEDLDRRIAKHLESPEWFEGASLGSQRAWSNQRHLEIEPMRLQREAVAKRIADAYALIMSAPTVRIDGPDRAA